MGWCLVFAQIGRNADPLRSPEVIWSTAILALALLVGAFFVYLADRWRKGAVKRSTDAASELTLYRQMFQRGEITEDEYARLREKVAQRVKALPPAPATAPLDLALLPETVQHQPTNLPGPDQPTPPPDPGKPANPSSPA